MGWWHAVEISFEKGLLVGIENPCGIVANMLDIIVSSNSNPTAIQKILFIFTILFIDVYLLSDVYEEVMI